MPARVRVQWNTGGLELLVRGPQVANAMERLAGQAVLTMKRLCPVSPVYPVYAQPVPVGRSAGPVYGSKGKGVAWQRGPSRPRRRLPGDLPLPASGTLRSSIRREPRFGVARDGSILIGPTAPYARYVEEDTRPHVINSTGPWPLRNRVSGQVFGRTVHHPGTTGQHFIRRTAEALSGTVIRA